MILKNTFKNKRTGADTPFRSFEEIRKVRWSEGSSPNLGKDEKGKVEEEEEEEKQEGEEEKQEVEEEKQKEEEIQLMGINTNANNKLSEDLIPKPRKYADEDVSNPNWAKHKKHVFVLSNAGKPIYSRYGDESKLAPFMGVLQAIVSFVDEQEDELRSMIAGNHKMVFLTRGPLYFVMVSETSESERILKRQLEYVYFQVIALLTTGINKIFENKAQFDLRGLLGGAEKFMDSLIASMDKHPQFLLGSVQCLRVNLPTRTAVGNAIKSSHSKDIVYALLFSNDRLITLCRPKKHILHPEGFLSFLSFFLSNSFSFFLSNSLLFSF